MHVCLFSLYRGREPWFLPIFFCAAKMCCWTDGKRREVKQTKGQQIHGAPSFSHPPPPQPTFMTEKAAPQNCSACIYFFFHDCNFHTAWQCSSHRKKKTSPAPSRHHTIPSPYQGRANHCATVCVSKMLSSIPTDQIKWISLIMSGWVRNCALTKQWMNTLQDDTIALVMGAVMR